MTPVSEELSAYYQQLHLQPDATSQNVDDAYFKLRAQKIREDARQDLAALKVARDKLKAHLQTSEYLSESSSAIASDSSPSTHAKITPIAALSAALQQLGFASHIKLQAKTLHIGIQIDLAADPSAINPNAIKGQIYQLLSKESPEAYGLDAVETVRLYGLDKNSKLSQQVIWKKAFPLPRLKLTEADTDLYSFDNRLSSTLFFPGLLLLAAGLNIDPFKSLLFGISIWLHECGHATVAWLCGYRALPLPFGWTSISNERSLFVYFGILTLFGLLFWSGLKEKRRWPIVLAGILAVLQFYLTWMISEHTTFLLFSFGGIGGEFYLSALLIVSFFFPLPDYWRWDFYRYPAAIAAGFTFIGSFSRWQKIDKGLEAIPWGTLFGGAGDAGGDMNQLTEVYGWSDQRIIDTYNGIGTVCAIAIISVYFYVFLKNRNHLYLYALWQNRRLEPFARVRRSLR